MNVLVVGLGSIAAKHIAALQIIEPKTKFYALRSSSNTNSKKGIVNVFSIDDLENISIDFAIISNPTSEHKNSIKSLIPKKIPLFIEKPLFSELGNEKIIEEIQEKNVITYVACNLRFLGCLQFAKEYIQDKRINEVNIYCGSYLPNWRPEIDYKKTYSANKDLGGGVHIDLIHEVDYAYWLFGKPNNVNKMFSSKSTLEINAYDYANYVFEYATFNTSVILNYYRKDPKRTLEIVCEKETLTIDLLINKVYRNQKEIYSSEKTILDTYEDQLRFFVTEVLDKAIKFNTAKEAYEILKICLLKD